MAKYDTIGKGYNNTRMADGYLTERLLHHLEPNKNGLYLDIGCGTGNYTNALHQLGYDFIGIDPSKQMLDIAKTMNDNIDWRIGSAEKIELNKNSVDGIIAFLTLHHWNDLDKAFLELNRVLKRDGKFVIFTSTQDQMRGYWLNHYFPKMMDDSINQMPTLNKVRSASEKENFKIIKEEKYFVLPGLQDQFLYCGKQNPELYFNENIRKGISSFSSLSNEVEVKNGLVELRRDINSGKVGEIINNYKNNFGDYLYLVGAKKEM